ncbi:MAG: hypothetical protein FJX59_09315 [Alphaproteobacteria bacterium]|nr:hypothetical protein [Alphaproteobacteria bacterium]
MYIAHFDDHPATHHIRRAHQAAHSAYLAANAALIAGEVVRFVDDLGRPVGGMWLINTDDRATALKLCHGDPFWIHGLRKDVTLVAWRPTPYDLRVAHA